MHKLKFIFLIPLIFSTMFISFSGIAKETNEPSINQQQINSDIIQININQATVDDFVKNVKGVGINKAKKIIEYREKFGPFVSIEQLKEVSGIGQAILDKNAGVFTL